MAKMKNAFIIFVATLCMVPLVPLNADGLEEHDACELLVDYGNGAFEWFDISREETFRQVIDSALPGRVEYHEGTGGCNVVRVDQTSNTVLGSNHNIAESSWRLYWWNSVEWEFMTSDASDKYPGGDIALAFYSSDTIPPVSNPDYKDVWTSYRGNSSSSSVSPYHGPEKVGSSPAWSVTYPGGVDSTVLYADGMIYHTSAGLYGSVGMDALARINCLDPVNKKTLWSVPYSNSDRIEITTPVILGDMILVTSGNWHIYCLDRFTGEPIAELCPLDEEGDMCKGTMLSHYIKRTDDPSVSSDRVHLEGGITNAVYENGALYFGTADGLLRCYSVDRENGFREIWNHRPDGAYRGCFYFQPPVPADIDGRRCILAGNYAGGLICVDSRTGDSIWAEAVTDGSGKRVGSVFSISVCSGGRALIGYSSGEMNAIGGGMMLIDLSDGSTIWKHDVMCGTPVVYGDRFYSYVSAVGDNVVTDSQSGAERTLETGYCSFWVDDFSLLWNRPTDAICKGGITYSDGRLYSMDYSPGTEGESGGSVWCLDSDTGDIVWKSRVVPYSGNAYSMCTPTVVNGQVFVGNDYGAVYVLSDVGNSTGSQTSEIDYSSQGLKHWSWILTLIIAAVTLVAATVFYMRW